MSATENKAVFLSYASQDAEVARRICDALRAAGVEVWFDQSELRGGDAWDAKIRRQVATCELFIPVISANTQARLEGYFRIEWKLAAQRTHAMAEEKTFLLPVVIDATRDAEAKVPAEFKTVQWTSLRQHEALPGFAARVRTLLDGGAPPNEQQRPVAGAAMPIPTRRGAKRVLAVASLALALCLAAAAIWQFRPKGDAEFDAKLRSLLSNSREETAMAEEAMRRLTETEPHSARAWSARAFVQSIYLTRGWDNSDKRRQDTQTFARNALAIDPRDTRAIMVLAKVFINQGAYQEAEAMARRALAVRGSEGSVGGTLAMALSGQGRFEEARTEMEEAVRRWPDSSGPHYQLALLYETLPNPDFAAALKSFEAARTAKSNPEPSANVLIHEAALTVGLKGDLVAARALLDQVSPVDRMEDRAVGTAMAFGLLERQPSRVIAAGAQTARDYFEDLYVPGPKAWRLALAQRIDGKDSLAQQEWQRAEAVLRQRLQVTPGNQNDQAALAATLAWLGRREEAAKLIAPIEAQVRESPPRVSGFAPDHLRILYLSYYYAGLGEAAPAVSYLRQLLNRRELLTSKTIPLDPWWDKIREQPEFVALLAEAKTRTAATQPPDPRPPEKSVAVLAFDNLSDDKSNEYFSEGISEELLNVLAKVPGLKVTARTSAFSFKGRQIPIPEIARQLGVAYVIEGSVRKMGRQVRVSARLIHGGDGSQAWTDEFRDELNDNSGFALQDKIAAAIAANLQLRLAPSTRAPVNGEAFQLYLQARQAWNLRTLEGYNFAEPLVLRAIELAPDFAAAHALLADVQNMRGAFKGTITAWKMRHSAEGEQLLRRSRLAIASDAASAEAHASLGQGCWTVWRFDEAERELREAIRLNPNYASAHQWLGRHLGCLGRLDEALVALKRATELDPLAPRILDNYAWVLLFARRPAEALDYTERALRQQPGAQQALALKAQALLDLQRADEAAAIADKLPQSAALSIFKAVVLAGAGKGEAVVNMLPELVEGHHIAKIAGLAALGRKEEALNALDPDWLVADRVDVLFFNPVFDPLRSDPRFLRAIATVGLSEAHARAQAWRAAHPPQNPTIKK
jgi:TolB-like protein/Flp pilus assembly protein TadD